MDDKTKQKLARLYSAWNTPGRVPLFHYAMKAKLRKQWPVLASALDSLKPEDFSG